MVRAVPSVLASANPVVKPVAFWVRSPVAVVAELAVKVSRFPVVVMTAVLVIKAAVSVVVELAVMSNPLSVLLAVVAGMVTFNPFHTQVLPPVQAVSVGDATLIGLIVLVPLAPVVTLIVESIFKPFVVEVTAAVVASVKVILARLPVSAPWA